MKNRRDFFKGITFLGLAGLAGLSSAESAAQTAMASGGPIDDRGYWTGVMERLANPVLGNLARGELKKNMPVEQRPKAGRERFTYLEAFGRLLCGIAPWLALENLTGQERDSQQKFIRLAQGSLDAATDPQSPDFMNFSEGAQPLVDAAFVAQGILRAQKVLWQPLEPRVKTQIIAALKTTRKFGTATADPWVLACNWVMFEATIEAALLTFGEPTREERLESCLRKMLGWYCGDGAYGDGEFFHFDFYNSFVIQPMLLDVLAVLKERDPRFEPVLAAEVKRAQRYAEVLERLIAPDGTFPSLGRSTAYRFGAFQVLSQMTWRRELPEGVAPAQVRCALTAVIRKMIEAPGTFDSNGWLQIGFYGHQPALGESYISTGSLYLCAAGLLPLGLPPDDEFWSAPASKWTQQEIWSGENVSADHAITDVKEVEVPTLSR